MNVLVTGGSGRGGTYILRELLEHGHTAVGCGRTPPSVEGVPLIFVDIGSLESTRGALRGHNALLLNLVDYAQRQST